jgi:hypothetical protein
VHTVHSEARPVGFLLDADDEECQLIAELPSRPVPEMAREVPPLDLEVLPEIKIFGDALTIVRGNVAVLPGHDLRAQCKNGTDEYNDLQRHHSLYYAGTLVSRIICGTGMRRRAPR